MFCPECGAEYREGISRCSDCEVALTDEAPDLHAGEPMVAVFRSADATLLPVVRSVLAASDIPFSVQGDEASGLFPFGRAQIVPDSRRLGAVIRVPESRAEEATALIESAAPPAEDDEEESR